MLRTEKKIASSCTFVYWCRMIESRSRWKRCHWDAVLKCGKCDSQSSQGNDRIQEAELSQFFQNKIKFNALRSKVSESSTGTTHNQASAVQKELFRHGCQALVFTKPTLFYPYADKNVFG